jgi:hypothetical protein
MTPEDIHIALLRLLDIVKIDPPEPVQRQLEDFLQDLYDDGFNDGGDGD